MELSRAGEVCSQKIWLSRNPREAATLAAGRPKPAVLPRASQSPAAATSHFRCLPAVMALEGTSPLPETAANHLSHLTEGFFPPTCHWKTLTLTHPGKRNSRLFSAGAQGAAVMLVWHRLCGKSILPPSHFKLPNGSHHHTKALLHTM